MYIVVSKPASNVLRVFEPVTKDYNFSSSFGWSFSGINVKHLWWSIIVIRHIIISILLVVKCNFNIGLLQNKVRWGFTIQLGRVNRYCLNFTNTFELTESIVRVVNFRVNEGHEVITSNYDFVTTAVRTIVRY